MTSNGSRINAIGFNPRARDGREELSDKSADRELVSIHAPVMDANAIYKDELHKAQFQSTRP